MDSAGEVSELLDERPDLEPALEAVLDAEPPWDFHDVDVDSGRFGELVAKGVVEKAEEGYRVPDREAVERALSGEIEAESDRPDWDFPEFSLTVDRLEVALVLGALALVVAFRLLSWPTVFRQGHVVLSGNDPYYYRYLVEQLLATSNVQLSALPSGLAHGEPLLVVTLWLVTHALGGTPDVAGHVLAWYPVVTAAITALLLYGIAVLVTDDRRIGLAAVAMLAVLPGHAMRTSLGFADHHPFDYLWLAVTLFGILLVVSSTARRDDLHVPQIVLGVAIIAIGLSAQTLAWDNSPLLIAALAPFLALEALRAVHRDESPLRTLGPVLAGLTVATTIVWTVHDRLGWHTELVTAAPLLVLLGGIGIVIAAELFHRLSLPASALAGAELLIAATLGFGLQSFRPEMWARLLTSIEARLLARRPIAEVISIFSDSWGWLLLFGFILIIATPYLVWASYRTLDDARWIPPAAYAWYFLVLSAIQARFVGQLSPIIAIFAGLAFVHLAEIVDLARRPAPFTANVPPTLQLPSGRQVGSLLVLFLLVSSLSIIQVPVLTAKVTAPPEQSDTAHYLADYSDERDIEYPGNYVLSEWSWNRLYNYFVNGESRSYSYASETYPRFIGTRNPDRWYRQHANRVGFVVTTPNDLVESDQLGAILHRDNGRRTDAHPGVARYRLVYASKSGQYKAFALVEGGVIKGQTEPGARVNASTRVDVPGASFTYVRRTTADGAGNYSVRVAYPGTYRVAGQTVSVSPAAIRNGSTVRVADDSR